MNTVELSRTEVRRSMVGAWHNVESRWTSSTGLVDDETELIFTPHNTQWPPVKIFRVNSRDSANGWLGGWYAELGGADPEHLSTRRDEAMLRVEVIVAVRVSGGRLDALSGGKPRDRHVECSTCGHVMAVS